MFLWTERKRLAVVLVATLVLVFQSLGSAWALGGKFGQLDAFGNPLCISDKVQDQSKHPSDHIRFQDCCALACGGWTAPMLPPQNAVTLLLRQVGKSPPAHNFLIVHLSMRPDGAQGRPRAPPFRI